MSSDFPICFFRFIQYERLLGKSHKVYNAYVGLVSDRIGTMLHGVQILAFWQRSQ